MDIHKFEATTKYQIGDVVTFANGTTREITDIACVHYCRSGKIDFLIRLNNSNIYNTLNAWALENTKTND